MHPNNRDVNMHLAALSLPSFHNCVFPQFLRIALYFSQLTFFLLSFLFLLNHSLHCVSCTTESNATEIFCLSTMMRQI